MNTIRDNITTAFLALWNNKLRSILSMLGIIIGILTVSSLLTLAFGVQDQVKESIGELGANVIIVTPGQIEESGGFASQVGASTLTENDFDTIQEKLPEAENLSMAMILSGSITANEKSIPAGIIMAGTPDIQSPLNVDLERGRFIEDKDDKEARRVVVLGNGIAKEAFQNARRALGKNIEIRGETFEVIGVLKKTPTAALGGPDMNTIVVMPLRTGWDITDTKQIFRIFMQAPNAEDVKNMKQDVQDILRDTHKGEKDFSVITQEDILDLVGTILNSITYLLGAIAGISLIVGGIGIMNIMLVSVTERTREIGIRKSVGATRGAILAQFLTESVILTVLAGIISVIIFAALLLIAKPFVPFPLSLDPIVFGGAILFAIITGIIFGILPAYRASRMHPIAALRYE